jgi:hypothetical protein
MPPTPYVGGGGRKVTPRSSSDDEGTRKARRDENDDDIGHDGGGTVGPDDDRVVRGRDDDCDDCDDRIIEDGTSTSAPGKRRRGSSRHSTTDVDDGGGGGGDACIDSPARGAFVAGYDGRVVVVGGNRRRKAPLAVVADKDRVRRRVVATSLLARAARRCPCSHSRRRLTRCRSSSLPIHRRTPIRQRRTRVLLLRIATSKLTRDRPLGRSFATWRMMTHRHPQTCPCRDFSTSW